MDWKRVKKREGWEVWDGENCEQRCSRDRGSGYEEVGEVGQDESRVYQQNIPIQASDIETMQMTSGVDNSLDNTRFPLIPMYWCILPPPPIHKPAISFDVSTILEDEEEEDEDISEQDGNENKIEISSTKQIKKKNMVSRSNSPLHLPEHNKSDQIALHPVIVQEDSEDQPETRVLVLTQENDVKDEPKRESVRTTKARIKHIANTSSKRPRKPSHNQPSESIDLAGFPSSSSFGRPSK